MSNKETTSLKKQYVVKFKDNKRLLEDMEEFLIRTLRPFSTLDPSNSNNPNQALWFKEGLRHAVLTLQNLRYEIQADEKKEAKGE